MRERSSRSESLLRFSYIFATPFAGKAMITGTFRNAVNSPRSQNRNAEVSNQSDSTRSRTRVEYDARRAVRAIIRDQRFAVSKNLSTRKLRKERILLHMGRSGHWQ